MTKKFTSALFILLLLLPAYIFASGGDEVSTETTMPTDMGDPIYGGTLNMITSVSHVEPPSPDINDSNYFSLRWMDWFTDRPICGDIMRGPKGTNEYAFQVDTYVPEEYWVGQILSDWEITKEKLTWYVRPGMYWAADHVDFMENREVTNKDVAADLISFWKSPWGNRFEKTVKDIYAEGDDKVIIEFKSFSHEVFIFFGYEDRAGITPPEVLANAPKDWESQVGSGPFVFEEYVVGSHMSYTKNENYWDTTVVNGKEYQIPFIDRVVVPIIPDQSTQEAALRTGKVDIDEGVSNRSWANLERTAPDLQKAHYSFSCSLVAMRKSIPPFDDVDLRRAMMIGTDLNATRRFALAEQFPMHAYPAIFTDPTVYIDMEDLPEDVQELYDYDPEKAKKMVADAGYPDGLDLELYTDSNPITQDLASLLQDMWEKIGVRITIVPHEPVEQSMFMNSRTYPSLGLHGNQIASPMQTISVCARTGGWGNRGDYTNERVDVLSDLMVEELDIEKRTEYFKEAFAIMRYEVDNIPLYMQPAGHYWWPWLKNHHGELSTIDGQMSSLARYWWIDEDLKAEMGY